MPEWCGCKGQDLNCSDCWYDGHTCHDEGCRCSNCGDEGEVKCEECWSNDAGGGQCAVCEGGESGEDGYVHVKCYLDYVKKQAEEEINNEAAGLR